jgi:hypothetical protein
MELSPDDYFDPLDSGKAFWVQSVPQLLNAYEYTPHTADELEWTVVEITDGTAFWIVRTQLLDGMRSIMHHSQQTDGTEELIHSTEMTHGCWHTIRTLKQPRKLWAVVMNSLTVEQPGSLTADRSYCERQSFDERKGFGTVR